MKLFPATSVVITTWYKHLSVIGWFLVPLGLVFTLAFDTLAIVLRAITYIIRVITTGALILLGWVIIVVMKEPFDTPKGVVTDAWDFTDSIKF